MIFTRKKWLMAAKRNALRLYGDLMVEKWACGEYRSYYEEALEFVEEGVRLAECREPSDTDLNLWLIGAYRRQKKNWEELSICDNNEAYLRTKYKVQFIAYGISLIEDKRALSRYKPYGLKDKKEWLND